MALAAARPIAAIRTGVDKLNPGGVSGALVSTPAAVNIFSSFGLRPSYVGHKSRFGSLFMTSMAPFSEPVALIRRSLDRKKTQRLLDLGSNNEGQRFTARKVISSDMPYVISRSRHRVAISRLYSQLGLYDFVSGRALMGILGKPDGPPMRGLPLRGDAPSVGARRTGSTAAFATHDKTNQPSLRITQYLNGAHGRGAGQLLHRRRCEHKKRTARKFPSVAPVHLLRTSHDGLMMALSRCKWHRQTRTSWHSIADGVRRRRRAYVGPSPRRRCVGVCWLRPAGCFLGADGTCSCTRCLRARGSGLLVCCRGCCCGSCEGISGTCV